MDTGKATAWKRLLVGSFMLGLSLSAALLLILSFGLTVEAESPEGFPGLRDNQSELALIGTVFAVVITAILGTVAVAMRRSHIALTVAGAIVCGLLLAAATYRTYALIPILKCAGHNAVAQQSDRSYGCYDR